MVTGAGGLDRADQALPMSASGGRGAQSGTGGTVHGSSVLVPVSRDELRSVWAWPRRLERGFAGAGLGGLLGCLGTARAMREVKERGSSVQTCCPCLA